MNIKTSDGDSVEAGALQDLATSKRDRILNAAEELFALHGYDGVTLRQIAGVAGVDVALANYHFGKKRQLFEATFQRRADILNSLRIEALTEAQQQADGNPSLNDIISAFLRPIQKLQSAGDKGWLNYLALVAYVNASSVWGHELMSKSFDPLVSRYIEAFQKVFPDVELKRIHWAYHYLSGALTLTLAQTGRIDRLSEGLCQSSDTGTAYDLMIPFIVAGFEGICHGEGPSTTS